MARLTIKKLSRAKGRTLIIGDIHGCLDELATLVDAFSPGPGDRMIAVGDLINGGPDSSGVLRYARQMAIQPILGNHELRLLGARSKKDLSSLREKDQRTYDQLDGSDWDWIEDWPHVLRIPSINVLVVHGGFHPFKPWRKQKPGQVTTIQVIDDKGRPAKRADAPDGQAWGETWKGPEHVYYGHTPRPEPLYHPFATGLDTGCVYGYTLSAISLPDMELYQVQAVRDYSLD